MSTVDMRARLKTRYSSPKWRNKVSRMSDGQVVAIFFRMQSKNEI